MEINKKLGQQIVDCGVKMLRKGFVTGTGGNISVRVPGADAFMITPSGVPYEDIRVEDLVILDFDGNQIGGTKRASVERNMHRLIYKARPDVNAIVHTHSNYASAFSTLRRDMDAILDAMVCVFGGGVRTSKYARIGTEELAENVAEALGNRNAAFVASHGCVGVGQNLEGAFGAVEFLEACCITYFAAKTAGEPSVIDDNDIEATTKNMAANYGQEKTK